MQGRLSRGIKATLAAVAVVASVCVSPPSANAAAAAGMFAGQVHYACFGCGQSSGTGQWTVVGTAEGRQLIGAILNLSYTVNESPVLCPVAGTASGTMSGAFTAAFTWTRVGSLSVISISGGVSAEAVAEMTVTSPLGNPCGGPVTALVTGVLGGA